MTRWTELGKRLGNEHDAELVALAEEVRALLPELASREGCTDWYFYLATSLATCDADERELGWTRAELIAEIEVLARDHGRGVDLAQCALVRSEMLEQEGLWEQALEVLGEPIDDWKSTGRHAPYVALRAARIWEMLGEVELAREMAEAALERIVMFPAGDEQLMLQSFARARIAGLYMRLGLADRADQELAAAEAVAGRIVNAQSATEVREELLLHRCDYFLGTHQHAALVDLARRALAKAKGEVGAFRRVAELELRLAIALSDLDYSDPDRARDARFLLEGLLRAEPDARPELEPVQLLRARIWLLELDMREGALGSAGERVAAIANELERVAGDEGSRLFFDLRTHFACLCARWTRARAQLAPAQERLELLEQGRSEALAAWRGLRARWAALPQRPGGIGFLNLRQPRMLLSELVTLELAVTASEAGAARAFQHLHDAQTVGGFAREAGYDPVPMAELLGALCTEGTGLLVYLPSDMGGHLFCIDSRGVLHVGLGPTHRIRKLADGLVDILLEGEAGKTESRLGAVLAQGADLGRELLPDAARARTSGWKAALVVGAEPYGYAPFEYISLDGARWLYEGLPIAYLPSVPFGMVLARRPQLALGPSAVELLVVAATQAREPHFPFARREREVLLEGFDEAEIEVLTSEDADCAALATRAARGDRMWHILGHGDFALSELRTGVALAHGELLTPLEVLEWKGAPRLALLSVCRAGQGASRWGDDAPVDLGRAFLARGSSVAILPRAGVEYRAQMELGAVFVRRLREGASPARALSDARAALARSEEFSHPFNGLVHVVGLGDRPLYPVAPEQR